MYPDTSLQEYLRKFNKLCEANFKWNNTGIIIKAMLEPNAIDSLVPWYAYDAV